jgi:hypothetical protein
MRGAILTLPHYVYMTWCLIKHRGTFTFTFYSLLPDAKFNLNPLVSFVDETRRQIDVGLDFIRFLKKTKIKILTYLSRITFSRVF